MSRHRAVKHRAVPRRLALVLSSVALVAVTVVASVALRGAPAVSAQGESYLLGSPVIAAELPVKIRTAVEVPADKVAEALVELAPPADSGEGRRIVFQQGRQRVWLIDESDDVLRTYLVSGSKHDNLKPGSYRVLSKSRHAMAFDASGSMEYFVRFATGWSEPIGFHSIPVDSSGALEQDLAELGTPLSAGCVRQEMSDAIALWDFAPVGTKVTVVR